MSAVPTIGSFMKVRPYYIEGRAGIHEAQVLMERHTIRHLPVTEDGRLVGLVTDRDIRLILDPMLSLPPMRKVRDVMIDNPYVVDVDEPLDVVLTTMGERRIGSVLVTQNDKLVGIFTSTDAVRMLRDHYRGQRDA